MVSAGDPSPITAPARRPTLLLTVLSTTALVAAISQAMVIPLLPRIQHQLGLTPAGVTWALTGYLLAAAVATPLMGRLADMHGKRRVLLIGIAVSAVGALVSACWVSTPGLILGRVLQSGLTAVFPMALSIVRDQMPAHRLRPAVGTVSALFGAGGGGGLIAASLVAELSSGYEVAFLGLTVLLVACIGVVAWAVPESPLRTRARLDIGGAALLAIWLAALLLGVTDGSSWGWLSAPTLGLLAVAAVAAAAWWAVESQTAAPLVDTRVFVRPAVLVANVGQLMGGFSSFVAFIGISDWVQTPRASGYGFSASVLGASFFLLPWTVTSIAARALAVRLLRRVDLDAVLAGGALVVAGSFTFLGISHGSAADLYIASGGAGLGLGLMAVVTPILVVEGAPQAQMGVATSMNMIARNIGGAVGASVVAALLGAAGTGAAGYPPVGGYVTGFLLGSGSCVALALVVAGRHRRHGGVTFLPAVATTAALTDIDTASG